VRSGHDHRRIVPEMYDPGWKAEVDGRQTAVRPYRGAFLEVPIARGARSLVLRYDPIEVRVAGAISLAALATIVAALARACMPRPARKIPWRAWKAASDRVRIELVISSRPSSSPAPH